MKFGVLLVFSHLIVAMALAQVDRETPQGMDIPSVRMEDSRIFGKIIDTRTNKGVEAASVQLIAVFRINGDGQLKDSLISGMLTRSNGDFSFEEFPRVDSFRLVVTAIGFEPIIKIISFNEGRRSEDRFKSFSKDVGNIALEPEIKQLGNVTVISERPALQLGIDRKIFNVEKSLTSVGGTGLDVLKIIPSVNVDVEGNILLRNSSPQIWVDGRPTILTLDQIPADNIEKVELITNPSAKFDAASTGGIINVVLKKNKRIGLNGIVSVGAGSADFRNANTNLNLREGKVNFFVSGSFNQSGGEAEGSTFRQNKDNGTIENYFNQVSINDRLRRFGSVRFGVDYFIDNRNTLSLTQSLVRGRFGNEEEQEQEYLNSNKVLERYGSRSSESRFKFNRNSTRLNYIHKFPEEGKELTGNVDYNFGSGNDFAEIFNTFFNADGSEYSLPAHVLNIGDNESNQLTFQFDFTNPAGENKKTEMGIRSYTNNYKSKFDAYSIDNNNNQTLLPLSNNYEYREMVNAAYFTYTGKWEKLGYQLGLRAEHSKFDGELVDSARKFGYEYPAKLRNIWDALFPSVFISKELGEEEEIQVNYTRRIRRPNFWQLNPFIDINDPVNLRQGNPELRPEFTNSFELNYSKGYEKGNFLTSLYYRNTESDITRYSDTISAQQYQQLNNAAVDPNAILNTFINANSTKRMGAEFTLQHRFGKNFDFTPSLDFQYRKVNVSEVKQELDNEGFNWEANLTLNYKIETPKPSFWNNLSFQVRGEYESPEIVAQGKRKEEYDVDFALRKDFLKNNKATFTFSINDVFNSHRFGAIYDTETFYQESYRRRNVRSFRLTFSYKFGDPKFNLFRRGGDREGGGDRSEE